MPISAVLANHDIMDVITPGTHGYTFCGNPLGCAIAINAINLLYQENMIDNSRKLGSYMKKELIDLGLWNKELKNEIHNITKKYKGFMIAIAPEGTRKKVEKLKETQVN